MTEQWCFCWHVTRQEMSPDVEGIACWHSSPLPVISRLSLLKLCNCADSQTSGIPNTSTCQVLTSKLNARVAERVHSLSLEIRHQSWNRVWLRRGSNLIACFFGGVLCEGAGAKPGGRCASLPVILFPYGSRQLQAGKNLLQTLIYVTNWNTSFSVAAAVASKMQFAASRSN